MQHPKYFQVLFGSFMVVMLFVVSGCGNSRHPVSGAVTLDKEALTNGTINFRPIDGTAGNSSGGMIDSQGRFSIHAAQGLKPGKYQVEVQVWQKTDQTFKCPHTGKQVNATAPVQFNENRTEKMQATINAGKNQIDFHLTSVK